MTIVRCVYLMNTTCVWAGMCNICGWTAGAKALVNLTLSCCHRYCMESFSLQQHEVFFSVQYVRLVVVYDHRLLNSKRNAINELSMPDGWHAGSSNAFLTATNWLILSLLLDIQKLMKWRSAGHQWSIYIIYQPHAIGGRTISANLVLITDVQVILF